MLETLRRSVTSPEGIELTLTLAPIGDRATAFIIDILILLVVMAAVGWLGYLAGASGYAGALVSLLLFFLRSLYFMFCELRMQGRTLGKRYVGIRVVDRRGGRLTAGAIVARNVSRELEFFLPLAILLTEGPLFFTGLDGVMRFFALFWVLAIVLMPRFTIDNQRVGDLLADTWVVRMPKAVLEHELAQVDASAASEPRAYTFTAEQLGYYGVYELQVLERMLRVEASDARQESLSLIREKIVQRIGFAPYISDDQRFLQDFYAAQREHLETGMLFGERKERKG